jgi:hypothetical protein
MYRGFATAVVVATLLSLMVFEGMLESVSILFVWFIWLVWLVWLVRLVRLVWLVWLV